LPTVSNIRGGLAGCAGLLWAPTWDRAAIQAFQERRLRALVRHAYHRVPYYRRLFDGVGLKPDHIRTLQDLERIPLTSRADLQRLPVHDVVAQGFDPTSLVVHRTSGSSGEPLNIRRTVFEDRLLQAYRLRVLFRLGMQVSDRRVAVVTRRLTGTPLYMKCGLLPYQEIDCLLPPDRILARLRETRPDVLRGYAGTLSWLAGYLTDTDRERIRPRFVTTDSELLTTDMRARIAEGFRARVVDFYDSHEYNMIAFECPSSGLYHLSEASLIAEVLRDGRPAGPGEDGELVGTALHSWSMPFLRFRLGDRVTRGPDRCPCGAPNVTLVRIQGRVADRFMLPDQTSVHPYTLVNCLLSGGAWIRRYQIIQEQMDRIVLKLVPLPGQAPPGEALATIRGTLGERLGAGVAVEIQVLEEIPAAPSGKFRPYFSMVRAGDARAATAAGTV
jgi:phenylacetate-CoA ligase